MTFTAILSALGLGPKTLQQAAATLETAKGTLDSVAALFAAAGLNLETMLAAGPDALKAHIASVSAKDGELATAQTKVVELEGKVQAATVANQNAVAKSTAAEGILSVIGATAATKPEEYSVLLTSHVKKEAALVLAATGHQPVGAGPATLPNGTLAADLKGMDRVRAATKIRKVS